MSRISPRFDVEMCARGCAVILELLVGMCGFLVGGFCMGGLEMSGDRRFCCTCPANRVSLRAASLVVGVAVSWEGAGVCQLLRSRSFMGLEDSAGACICCRRRLHRLIRSLGLLRVWPYRGRGLNSLGRRARVVVGCRHGGRHGRGSSCRRGAVRARLG